ncbi:unnamed protein product [Linum tenue]|uniref:Uncharacterized protein n=1 Tax=Linum tenue TaxID=586396 RepID=A0AAV0IGQ9_9ROSI|nr:unnamed protein product [Linum tenue]
MEKSMSFPQYSSSFSGEFGSFDDRRWRAGDHNMTYNFNGPNQRLSAADPEAKRKKRITAYTCLFLSLSSLTRDHIPSK